MPKFKNESEEANWWASRAGHESVKRKSAEAKAQWIRFKGSRLVAKLNPKATATVAIRVTL